MLVIGITGCGAGGLFAFHGDVCPRLIAVNADDSSPMRSSPGDDADVVTVGAVIWLLLATDAVVVGGEENELC